MRVVVDTNIVFSAILNTNSKIAKILLQPRSKHNFYSTNQLSIEIDKHKNRIREISKYTDKEVDRIIQLITSRIRFINIQLIPKESYELAVKFTHDVDIDDTEFVALTDHIRGRLWTGDKKLKVGLNKKNWKKCITTEELLEIRGRKNSKQIT